MRSASLLALVASFGLVLAGCIGPSTDLQENQVPVDDVTGVVGDVVPTVVDTVMGFEESVVGVAEGYAADLYEPTIDVSETGTIYIAGHTILVDTTGAPAFFSTDDGETWEQLPFAGPAQMPGAVPSGTPPPSDEIFIVAGEDGWAYGVDITLLTFPVNAWSGDGAELAYHNPNAYNRVDSTTQCNPGSLNDRPWAAYADGTLLMVNNPGGGPVQLAVMDVPPTLPTSEAPTWNTCASPGGYIPGIPDIREDGVFAVPQIEGDSERLIVVVGHKDDIFDLDVVEVTPYVNHGGSITSTYGIASFDAEGTLFTGIQANEEEDDGEQPGAFLLATSTDGGQSFETRTFQTEGTVRNFYMDGNIAGPGALVVWTVDGDSDDTYDWYVGHAQLGEDGAPVLENVALAIDEGPMPSAHVTGAAVGPDGRAYLAMYDALADPIEYAGSTPLSVFIQQDGATLPTGVVESVVDEVSE